MKKALILAIGRHGCRLTKNAEVFAKQKLLRLAAAWMLLLIMALVGCNKKTQPLMPSQDFVGTWGDGDDFIKINSISNDAIDFEWGVPNRGIETTGTAKIEGNLIVFVTNGGDFSGTMVFDGNGISLTVEKTGWPKIDAGAKWVYANKNEQGTESGGDLSLPPVIDLYQYSEEKYDPYEKHFRIWGWSKDGKVAYSYTNSEGGEATAYFTILQFMDNKKLFGGAAPCTYDDNDNWQPIDADTYKNFENYYCKEHGIVFTQAEYRRLPIVHNNKIYNVVVDIAKKEVSDGFFDGVVMVDNYRIFVDTDGKRKVVHEANAEEPTFNIFPLGYFISPFENRALLVMGKHVIGGYVWTSFVGCDLNRGFDTAAPVTFTVEEATERTYQGGYVFEDEGAGAYIAITPSGMVTDFRYVSIGFHGDGLFEEQTLFERPYIVGGQSFNVAWQASSIPQRGISYMDGGQRKYFYLQEDGMDGSINLVEFTPTAFG